MSGNGDTGSHPLHQWRNNPEIISLEDAQESWKIGAGTTERTHPTER